MEGVDCCVVPMTNRRQGNQLVAAAFNIRLKPGGDAEVCAGGVCHWLNYKEGMFSQGQRMQTYY